MTGRRRFAGLLALLPLAGCSGWQSALDPKGPAAVELAFLIWFFTALCTAVWVLVMLALAAALWRRRRARDPLAPTEEGDRKATTAVGAAVAATTVILIGLTLLSFLSNRTLARVGEDPAVTIRVIGHQWWWEVRYESNRPDRILTTANEIHIPTGEPVRLILNSYDVIHSFWVPSLAGKLDLVPGQENVLGIQADKAGIYRGQCAEFCGAQHAHMGMLVVAEPRAAFDAWWDRQLQPALEPASEEQRKGRDLFMDGPCVMCHKIGGTIAGGTSGPDLTHVAGRKMLAAATLPMSRGNLAAWIIDPQGIKPGAHMPVMELDGDGLNAIVAYLESLR